MAVARKQEGQQTIYNNLGPLCNPASAEHQLIGVWNATLVKKTARVLQLLGTGRSWVVHSESGLDEIAIIGDTTVIEVSEGDTKHIKVSAASFDLAPAGESPSAITTPAESAAIIERILKNNAADATDEKLVIINAAAAIYLAGGAADLPRAAEIANESIRNGAALDKLNSLRRNNK